jgi:hypothetical protein
MTRNRFTKCTSVIAGLSAGLLLAISILPLHAQTEGHSGLSYRVMEETTLNGTVSRVLARPGLGMIMGSHLLLATVSGIVDASLGRWGLRGKGALSVTPGQEVEVTGVMKTLNGRQVFMARSVKVSGKVYTMRNKYGIPVSPQARERAAQKGESL